MIDNKLKVIDFSAAVQSGIINTDFQCVKGWIDRENLRIGGYGLVEGFNMSYDNNFGITIDEGTLIDRKGEEIIVPQHFFNCGEPKYEQIVETVTVSPEGEITLKFKPYSNKKHGLITYRHPDYPDKPDSTEFEIVDASNLMHITPLTVEGTKVTVPATENTIGRVVNIYYLYCADRIDAFLVNEESQYTREIGINAESPSATDIKLGESFLIGFAHWIIGETVTVEFIVDDRTYRKVYVDNLNRLYLNGKLYKEAKWIYFEEPETPEENDIWYDYKSNTLMIWSRENGVYGWRIMNDFTNVPIRNVKMWIPGENYPDDGQSFLFDDEEIDLRFIPNTNALDIIIDQQIVMNDQFKEIVLDDPKPYLSSGIGFKLLNPLDRPTIVQAVVHHTVKNAPLKNVFQRAAIFVTENFAIYSSTNANQIFETDLPYVIQADQIEVFIDGLKLNKGIDFLEMRDNKTDASNTDKDRTTKFFRVIKNLQDGQKVSYRISRYVWSYDQLNEMISEIEEKADRAQSELDDLKLVVDNLTANITDKISAHEQSIKDIVESMKDIQNYRKKEDKITINDVDTSICDYLVKNTENITFNASVADQTISDLKDTDFLQVVCINANGSTILRKDADYSITYAQNQAIVSLQAELLSPDNTIFVSIIRFGR